MTYIDDARVQNHALRCNDGATRTLVNLHRSDGMTPGILLSEQARDNLLKDLAGPPDQNPRFEIPREIIEEAATVGSEHFAVHSPDGWESCRECKAAYYAAHYAAHQALYMLIKAGTVVVLPNGEK